MWQTWEEDWSLEFCTFLEDFIKIERSESWVLEAQMCFLPAETIAKYLDKHFFYWFIGFFTILPGSGSFWLKLYKVGLCMIEWRNNI